MIAVVGFFVRIGFLAALAKRRGWVRAAPKESP